MPLNKEYWAVDRYERTRRHMLANPERHNLRPHVLERCKEPFPITREEWNTTFERLNTPERFVLLSLLSHDLLMESIDYCTKNAQSAGNFGGPITYDDALGMECVPLLMRRLEDHKKLAESLGDLLLETEGKKAPLLPYKLTRVTVGSVKPGDEADANAQLRDWAAFGVSVLGIREVHWYNDFVFECMATTPQQINLAFHTRMLPARGTVYPYGVVYDEGKIDELDTVFRLRNPNWELPILEMKAKTIGCENIQRLNMGHHLFCRATEEQRSYLQKVKWKGREIQPVLQKDGTLPPTVKRRRLWPENSCLCADYTGYQKGTSDCHVCNGTGVWPD